MFTFHVSCASKRSFCSSVAKGTKFEELSNNVLGCFGFHLHRKGGAGDLGIDLQGFWQLGSKEECLEFLSLPSASYLPMINVVAQCKHEKKYCKPSYVRELDGVLSRWNEMSKRESSGYFIPPHLANNKALYENIHTNIPIIGMLVCSGGFTPSCITALQSSTNPMMFVTIQPMLDSKKDAIPSKTWYQSRLKFMKLNKAAQRIVPKLRIGDTFVTGSFLEHSHPSIVLFNDRKDISNHELPDY